MGDWLRLGVRYKAHARDEKEHAPRISARREDGAVLVTYGPAAWLISDQGRWLTSSLAALARGIWQDADEPLPKQLLSTAEIQTLREWALELGGADD